MEPSASGRHPLPTRASSFSTVISALIVLTLNSSVPRNCTAAAYQSARSAAFVPERGGRRPLSASWMNAARVKKTAPTAKVTFVQTGPTASA